jgi:2-amino-4-hydroxy-6-hydroxymethyldihydropteridine diphosphokinase
VKDAAALVLLGANLGKRERTLAAAVKGLRALRGVKVEKVSRLFETAPVGPSAEPYLNQAVRLRTSRSPMGLLVEFKTLEAEAGRRPGRKWSARLLDIDLVEYGRARVRTPWLRVPHPLMAGRLFAAMPLAELSPAWKRRLASMKPDPVKARIY